MKYQILHAERDFRYHERLKAAFANHPEFDFIDHCCYLDAGLQLLNSRRPAILITASKLYDETHVVEAFCRYRDATLPNLKIIILTSKEDMDHFLNSIVSGADGYISKFCTTEEIYECINTVINGDSFLGIQQQVTRHK
jgi:DNA-binding NarL/FixJ family response regulator